MSDDIRRQALGRCIDGNRLVAACGFCPFSQALMAALCVMSFGAKYWGCIDGNRLMAAYGCCPFSQGLTAAQ